MNRPELSPEDFNYVLPEGHIAQYPLPQREDARLLVFRNGMIDDLTFRSLPGLLPAGTQLVVNDTRVIHARVFLRKPSGGRVEVFLLHPEGCTVEEAMVRRGSSQWWCMVGGAKKWKEGRIELDHDLLKLSAEKERREAEKFLLRFEWEPDDMPFAALIDALGKIPLPPYMQREAEESDTDRYQTTYASHPGSVAAPTAGLHFSPDLIERMQVEKVALTLHVSAGTFRPISAERIEDHQMHDEECVIDRNTVVQLTQKVTRIAVGTTSLRTLESLYWLAVKLHHQRDIPSWVGQEDAYVLKDPYSSFEEAMEVLAAHLPEKEPLIFRTSIMIRPGYRVRSIDGIFTNFHMPKSTLILLVAAMIGDDWRRVYDHAIAKGYRFLSYGDGSLLMKQ